MSAGSSCSQMESRCHRGSGRLSVGGDHGVGRRYPGVPVFKQVLSRSKLARRCQSCGPCPPKGGAEGDDGKGGSWHVLVDGGRESSYSSRDCPSSSGTAVWSARCGSVRNPIVLGSRAVTFEARVLGRARVEPPTVEADSGFDGPVGVAAVLCRELETLMPWL